MRTTAPAAFIHRDRLLRAPRRAARLARTAAGALLLAGALGVTPVLADESQSAPADQTVQVQPNLTPGQQYQYLVQSTSTATADDGTTVVTDLQLPVTVLTLALNQDGSAQVEIILGQPSLTLNGEPQPADGLAGTQIQETINPDGTVSDVQLTPGPGGPSQALGTFQGGTSLDNGLLPRVGQQPTRVGQTVPQSQTINLPQGLGTLSVRTQTTLSALTDVNGAPAAQYDTTGTIPSATLAPPNGPAVTLGGTFQGTSLVDVASGWTESVQVNETLDLTVAAFGQQPASHLNVQVQSTVQLVSSGQVLGK